MMNLFKIVLSVVIFNPVVVSANTPFRVDVDKGTLEIEFVPMDANYSSEFNKVTGCLSDMNTKENRTGVEFKHTEQSCPMGGFLKLKLKEGLSVKVNMLGGVVRVLDTKGLKTHYSKIMAQVSGGVIQLEEPGFVTSGYAPSTAIFENRDKVNGATLDINLKGGVVQFR